MHKDKNERIMGYYRDWESLHPLKRCLFNFLGYWYWFITCMFLIGAVSSMLTYFFDNNTLGLRLKENIWLCTFLCSLFLPAFALGVMYLMDYVKKWRLTDEKVLILGCYHFSKMTRKQKKLMVRSIRLSPELVFQRFKNMSMSEAIKDFKHSDFNLAEQKPENVSMLLKCIPNMEHAVNGVTHTLREWEILLTEERIKSLTDKILAEKHRIRKYRSKSNGLKEADALNISYSNYERYTTFYNGIQKAIEQFGLNSKETKTAICFTIDRIGDLQEWTDFVSSKDHLVDNDTTGKGRYATYHTNIISNTSDNVNVHYTKGSFYVMAYFDNITYEEKDTFGHDNVTLYLYHYEFAYFLVMEFERLRFAVPLNIKDAQVDMKTWLNAEENEIRVNLVEKNDGRLITSRTLHLKRMNVIKQKVKIQSAFSKIVVDTGISKAINKSLDEMVYNGFVLEVIRGDRGAKEGYLRF